MWNTRENMIEMNELFVLVFSIGVSACEISNTHGLPAPVVDVEVEVGILLRCSAKPYANVKTWK